VAKAAHKMSETRAGALKGKLGYMSPEQCVAGQVVDRRSDVFSLAIILWELTLGRELYDQLGEFELLKAVVETDAPRPSTVRPGYPADLEHIVMRGLERDPSRRYSTAQALQIDLEEFAREHKLPMSSVALAALVTDLVPRSTITDAGA